MKSAPSTDGSAKEEAIKKLKEALPYVLLGIREVKTDYPEAHAAVIIAAQNPDGGGKMILTVNEPEELFNNIALALDITITEDDEMNAKAAQFLSKWGLK